MSRLHHQLNTVVFVVPDLPELKQVDQILLKQIHTATTTFILEVVKHNSDKSTIR